MENEIILGCLVVILVLALLRAKKHFKGGGCCGSGSKTIRDKKVLTEPVIGQKILHLEGMHCENCAIRVENSLNRIDGVLCKVNLKKKTATVSYSREVEDALFVQTVERLGYTVTEIY